MGIISELIIGFDVKKVGPLDQQLVWPFGGPISKCIAFYKHSTSLDVTRLGSPKSIAWIELTKVFIVDQH